jgi:imidazolonepropionase
MGSKTLYTDIAEILTLAPAFARKGRGIKEADLGIGKNFCLLVEDKKISWIGPQKKLPKNYARLMLKEKSLNGQVVLPGFVECHTHAVFAGSRAEEFELRNNGVSYQELAARGGGILSTVKATRGASESQLLKSAQCRADEFRRQGVTTLEIKSGYGLSLKDEVKCLTVIKKITGVKTVSTFLGAHARPPEFATYEEYLKELSDKILPVIKKKNLAERVDIFIEEGFFPLEPSRRFLERARELGFQLTIHADQLSLSGGSLAAVDLQALSADHVIQIGEKEIQRFAKSETTCVLLPAADLYMKCAYPPARRLLDAGARVALATDFNPGTSPTQDLNLVGLLSRLEMKMTLPEVIAAYTVNAAYALGRASKVGSLEIGKYADFISIDVAWSELFYSVGKASIRHVILDGKLTQFNS